MSGGWLVRNVPPGPIEDFISEFQNHPGSMLTDPGPVRRYIEDRRETELASWDVLLASVRSHDPKGVTDTSLGLPIHCQRRSAGKRSTTGNTLRVTNKQRVASRGTEKAGLTDAQIDAAQQDYRNRHSGKDNFPDSIYRKVRDRPLLIVHLLTIGPDGDDLSNQKPVVAWSISFPRTEMEEKRVDYVVNTTWWRRITATSWTRKTWPAMTTNDPWKELAAPETTNALSARRVDASMPWGFFWARDADRRHLLLLRHDAEASPTGRVPRLKGIETTLSEREADGSRLLALRLLDPAQRDIFHRLCLDIIASTARAFSEAEAVANALARTWRWHHLLRGGADGRLSIEEQKGLIGELLVLDELLLPVIQVIDALTAWRGPLGAPKDFEVGRICIEAKARRVPQHHMSPFRPNTSFPPKELTHSSSTWPNCLRHPPMPQTPSV